MAIKSIDFLSNSWQNLFSTLYGSDEETQKKQVLRYQKILDAFTRYFGSNRVAFFSAPGRTEISGNHTDHNRGKVLAASVNLDAVAAVEKSSERKIVLFSEGYPEAFVADLSQLKPNPIESGTTTALIRGIASCFVERGYKIGGFKAFVSSSVLPGSGLSSSAAIEVLIGTILNELYNSGKIPAEEIAAIGQFAENVFFGKPCGLMDQMASAVGGVVEIDFGNPERIEVTRVDFNLNVFGYGLLIVNTGGSHADLTADYAAIPAEMRSVAQFFGKDYLRDVAETEFFSQIGVLREKVGDRALLRTIHFFAENSRVTKQVKALKEKNFAEFLRLVNESGNSSWKLLQNVYSSQNPEEQGVTLALALTEGFLRKKRGGACRVHGGGFAGTIQVFFPEEWIAEYRSEMERIFGKGSVLKLQIRPVGALQLKN